MNKEILKSIDILSTRNKRLKNFVINLDLHPEERFKDLLKEFNLPYLIKKLNKLYNSYFPNIYGIDTILKFVVNCFKNKIMYKSEIEFWSNTFNFPFHKVLLIQILYELNSGCTTFTKVIDNQGFMIRTFDWPELLIKKLLYQATFIKNNKKIFEGVCILGCVGLFTGKSLTQDYSIAINYRRVNEQSYKTLYNNIKNIITRYWPVSYILRSVLEENLKYDDALNIIKNSRLISPVYFNINKFDCKPLIIQRNPEDYFIMGGDFVCQTNCDNDKLEPNIEYSIERRELVNKILTNENKLSKIIENVYKFPVIRDDTLYVSLISKDLFESFIINNN